MRKRFNLDRSWRFALGHAANPAMDFEFARSRCLVKAGEGRGAAIPTFDDSKWRVVDVPHDWALELPLDPAGDKELAEHGFRAIGPDHPEHSVGWYRRSFDLDPTDRSKRISLVFDGVFRESIVWVNGHRVGRHQSGYTSFRYDITDLVSTEGRNVIAVRVDATSWEGWWYEGAGIYRHVWLEKTAPLHVTPDGVFVTSEIGRGRATVTARTRVVNECDAPASLTIESAVMSGRTAVARAQSRTITLAPWESTDLAQQLRVSNPKLWSCDDPHLYTLRTTIRNGTTITDALDTSFGIRSIRWDAERGFFLNGKPLKIQGTCNHQHHAGVGIAMPDALHEWRVRKLKEMGCNAYRCAHYAVAPELLDACDRLGMLVMAENRLAGSSDEVLGQLASQIVRDRNHPSIICWSIANEEHTVQWAKIGERIGASMVRLAHRLDPTRPVTAAMHDRGLGDGFANVVDLHGWNYMRIGDIEAFHKARPDQPIVCSEESSTVCTRGEYADDKPRGYVNAYARRTPGWGLTPDRWWSFVAERPWIAGGFVWTGFDYYGEPIPYKWPCTASHFGLMDLCGFPKDIYWYYRAWWTNHPVLHLLPHWNWIGREGQMIDVRCFSNCERVELFVNDRSQGTRDIPRNGLADWQVVYEPGTLRAVGYTNDRATLERIIETTGPATRLELFTEGTTLRAGVRDVAVIGVRALDDAGRLVPTAHPRVHFKIDGPATRLGVGNGDPSSHESDLANHRALFNGLAMVLVQTNADAGVIRVTAESEGLPPAELALTSRRGPMPAQLPPGTNPFLAAERNKALPGVAPQ